ncbi:ATP-binding protein [Pseudonocardia cypriaca]|uniref:ATP-binding protein n=1 Tax=Pseudonocardia cypriaca TaxID=882449 RepID=UPI00114EA864|nr:hypothetical protein [Pseudonocardia cypriaca]
MAAIVPHHGVVRLPSARPLPPNVLEHAGPSTARIEIVYGERTFTLSVSDDGTGSAPGRPSADSHGIRGVRERAELYGDVLTAGPREEGGFAVILRLPISEDRP